MTRRPICVENLYSLPTVLGRLRTRSKLPSARRRAWLRITPTGDCMSWRIDDAARMNRETRHVLSVRSEWAMAFVAFGDRALGRALS